MATITVSAGLDKAVADFKAIFAANPPLVTNGQFQIQQATFKAVVKVVEDEFATINPVDSDLRSDFNDYKDSFTDPDAAARVLKTIKRKKLEAAFPETFKVFSPDPGATPQWAAGLWNGLWATGGISAAPMISRPTAAKVLAARNREVSACHDTAFSIARKFLLAKKSSAKPSKKAYSAGQMAGAALRTSGDRQTVIYNPTAFGAEIGKLRASMLDGYIYVVGALSGLNHTNVGMAFPNPEHWLVVFAQEGDTFVFWDSDLGTADISDLPTWGPGFGLLFARNNHFSTAVDSPDFDDLDSDGNHLNNTARHRYQVYLASPLS